MYRTVVMLSALLLSACSAGDVPSWAGSVDTLSDGTVLVRNPAEGLRGGTLARLVETLRIGSVDGGGPDQFGHVLDVTLDDLGRLYVLEGQAKEVRVFEAGGRHVRTLAGPGAGPGELQRPLALEWGPLGRLWIVDFGNRRYEVFDTAGTYIASHRLLTGSFGFSNRWGAESFLLERVVEVGDGGRRRMTVRRRLVGESLVVVDTLPVPEGPAPETIEVIVREGGQAFADNWPIPLAPRSALAQDPAGGWWISDPGTAYRIVELDLLGDTVRILERKYDPVPISDEEKRIALDDIPEGTELNESRLPSVHRPVDELLPGPRDLWVKRRTSASRTGYDVFDDEGRYVEELSADLPLDRFTLTDRRDDTAVGVLLGALDVPYVVMLAVEHAGTRTVDR